MADRTVRVRLEASAGGYIAAMGQAKRATDDLAKSGDKATKQSRDWDGMASGLGRFGLAAGAAVGFAVKTFADFDQAMSEVRANVSATPAEMGKLEVAIRDAGKASVFSATESAQAATELAKAGMSASDIMGGGLTGALNLAAAGGVSMSRAAEVSANALATFNLKASDSTRVADVLANGALNSTASIDSLALGLSQGGLVAASFGLSLEDTVGALAQFDQAGLKGSDAGTSLKTMLTALGNPSKQAAQLMDELGISAFDAAGNFIGLDGLAGQLQTSMSGLTQEQRNAAMATIFGSDAVRAANILFKDGQAKTKGWADGVSKAGTAAEVAGKRTDNLKGDLEKLKGALEDALIGSGSNIANGLRPVVQALTKLIDLVGSIPAPVLTAMAALTSLAAVGALLGSAGIKIMQGWQAGVAVLDSFNVRGTRAAATVRGIQAATVASTAATRASTAAVTANNVALGAFGSRVAAVGASAPLIARMQTAYLTAASGAATYGRSAGVAAAGTVAMSAAARGLMAALPVLGVAYAAVELSKWAATAQMGSYDAKTLSKELGNVANSANLTGQAFKTFSSGGMGPFREETVTTDEALKRFSVNARGHFASFNDGFSDWLGNLQDGGGRSAKFVEQVKRLDSGMAEMVRSGNAQEAKRVYEQFMNALDPKDRAKAEPMFKQYAAAVKQASDAAAKAKPQVDALGRVMTDASGKTKDAAKSAEDYTNALKGLGSAMLGMRGDQVGYQAALQGATDALKENGTTLDITTEKGRNNRTALDGIASSTTKWAQSTFEATGSMQQAQSILTTGSGAYVKMATAMGMPRAEAERLAASLFKLPANVATNVTVPGVEGAVYAIDKLGNQVIKLTGRNITIPASTPNAEQVAAVLTSVSTAALSADAKTVNIPTATLGAQGTANALKTIDGAALSADGKSVNIPTTALAAAQTAALLKGITTAAVTADGQIVVVPASTPNAKAVASALNGISASAVTADSKSVNIQTAAPLSPSVRAELGRLSGVAVSADGKSVNIDSRAPGAAQAAKQVRDLLNAAQNKSHTITTYYRTVGGAMRPASNSYSVGNIGGRATGGPAIPGAPAFAMGGTLQDYRRGGVVRGGGTPTSDSVAARLAMGQVNLSRTEHVVSAAEVARGGGHGTWYTARDLARRGRLDKVLAAGLRAGFAEGGTIARRPPSWSQMRVAARQPTFVAASRGPDYGREIAALASQVGALRSAVQGIGPAVAQGAEAGTARGIGRRESRQAHDVAILRARG